MTKPLAAIVALAALAAATPAAAQDAAALKKSCDKGQAADCRALAMLVRVRELHQPPPLFRGDSASGQPVESLFHLHLPVVFRARRLFTPQGRQDFKPCQFRPRLVQFRRQ